MIPRRLFLAVPVALAMPARAATASFDAFLDGVRGDARRAGVSPGTIQRALSGLRPNDRVLELDRKQPEGSLSWEEYRDRIVSSTRIEKGRRNFGDSSSLLAAICNR